MAGQQDDLGLFVRESLARGLARPAIEGALVAAGWERAQVTAAVGSYATVDFPVPVPRPRPYVSAREAFLYLLLFATLYVSAFNLGSLLFAVIDLQFPDDSVRNWSPSVAHDVIRWSISAIVVAAPVFLFLARLTSGEVRRDPAKRASIVRKQLTYLTLFVSAAILIGDVIALVYHVLGGELVIRFALKALVIGAIGGGVFGAYLRSLRDTEPAPAA